MEKRLKIVVGLLLAGAGLASAQGVANFVVTRALPVGRAFTYAIITGIASNATYDELKNALKGAPAPAPAPPPVLPPSGQGAPSPYPPALGPGLGLGSKPCLLASQCSGIDTKLSDWDKAAWQLQAPPAPPAPPRAEPPRAAPDCGEASLDGMTALRRAAELDQGRAFSKRNAPAAQRCYAIAARQGIPIAQFNLADMLMRGDEGVAQDRASAVTYLRSSAVAGFLPAQVRLAEAYEYGEGTPVDFKAAEFWYLRAADAGSASAQYRLAGLYYAGRGGVAQNWLRAFYWLRLALEQGYGLAREPMDMLLATVRSDAALGNRGAQNMMGIVYEAGVPGLAAPDPRRAIRAFRGAGNFRDADRLCGRYPRDCA